MHFLPLLGLFLSAAYYCHRFYGVFFFFDGDAVNFLYFRLNSGLIAADHNPFQFESMAGYPTGEGNPLLLLIQTILQIFSLSPIVKAVVTCLLMALVTQFLLTLAFYFFFYALTKSRIGSWIGSVVVSYTGFHLIGVREFNTMYAQSLLCTAGILWSTLQLQKNAFSPKLFGFISLCVGVSLLGGSNAPLFCFIPWLVFYLFFFSKENRLQKTGFLLLAIGLGILTGAFAWLPKVFTMDSLARGHIDFWGGKPPLTLKDLWIGLFFPEVARGIHWSEKWWNIQETACFLGAPVAWVTALGLWQKRKHSEGFFFGFLLLVGLAIVLSSHLPRGLTTPLAEFYSLLSIRNPNRFWVMVLPSVGYFAAHGALYLFNTKRSSSFIWVGLAMGATALWVILPNWNTMVPDAHPAIVLTSLASLLAMLGFIRGNQILTACMIFFMYAWAPIQFTGALWNYLDLFKQKGFLHTSHLSLKNVLGLGATYPSLFKEGERMLSTAPTYLNGPQTKQGRVFDDPTHDVHENYFAPQTGHRFAFSGSVDPARFKHINTLARIRTEAILGMSNVCTILNAVSNGRSDRMVKPIRCLPFAYWVPSALSFLSDAEGIQWLKTANLEQFSKQIGLFDESTPPLQASSSLEDPPPLKFAEQPGKIVIEGSTKQPGYVFISTAFRKDWRANLNGRATKLLRANLAYLAVKIEEKGPFRLEVQLDYSARYWAMILTGLGFILSFGIAGLLSTFQLEK